MHVLLQKTKWHTRTCVLGKDSAGIFPPNSDVTDVNAAHLSSDGKIIATADDFGFLKLYTFPCPGKAPKFKKYMGHSAHVTNVRWLYDDSKLITVGGADTSLIVWANAGAARSASANADMPAAAVATEMRVDSDDSDTDDAEDGYDSDVEREKKIDYNSKSYATDRPASEKRPNLGASAHADGSPPPKVTRGRAVDARVMQRMDSSSSATTTKAIKDLSLSFVHGYRGFDARNNIVYNKLGHAVYHAAGAGIVYNTEDGTQKFYLEHTDDIVSLALNNSSRYDNVIATGQVGVVPTIHIWDSVTLETFSIVQGFHKKAVCAVSFSADGKRLLSLDVNDTVGIAVYKWSNGELLASFRGPHQRIFVAEFRPDSEHEFVTCGVKHIKFWSVAGNQLVGYRGRFQAGKPKRSMLSVAFGDKNVTYSGCIDGSIYVWLKNQVQAIIPPIGANSPVQGHSGPIFAMTTVISSKETFILSGGKDGVVKVWSRDMTKVLSKTQLPENTTIRSVYRNDDVNPFSVIVGSKSNIYEIKLPPPNTTRSTSIVNVMSGHSAGELHGLATHPTRPLFASGSDDCSIKIWNLENRELLKHIRTKRGVGCRSLAFSPDGTTLVAGLLSGEVLWINLGNLLKADETDVSFKEFRVASVRDRNGPINDLKFSADGKLLAVASGEDSVDFYSNVLPKSRSDPRPTRTSRTSSIGGDRDSCVLHIDWLTNDSGESTVIQVNCCCCHCLKWPFCRS